MYIFYKFPTGFRQSDEHNVLDFMRTCPSSNKLFPEKVRKPLRNFITGSCPRTNSGKRLSALDFQASNADHLRAVYDMGITMVSVGDRSQGKVRLFHSFYNVSFISFPLFGFVCITFRHPGSFSTLSGHFRFLLLLHYHFIIHPSLTHNPC